MKSFGQLIREERVSKGFTLREFCRKTGFDPSYWSRIERGKAQPLKSSEFLNKVAEVLGIDATSDKFHLLKDTALVDSIPSQLAPEQHILDSLPLFFKTARGGTPTEDDMNKLLNIIRNETDGGEE